MIFKFYRVVVMLLLLAPDLPILFLLDVRSCDEDVVKGTPALVNGFFNDLDSTGSTDYLVRSGIPLSSG